MRNYRQRKQYHQPTPIVSDNNFGLKFNDDGYAIATDAFWQARKQRKRNTWSYQPKKIEGRLVGKPHLKEVWVVFVHRFAREAFEGKCYAEGLIE